MPFPIWKVCRLAYGPQPARPDSALSPPSMAVFSKSILCACTHVPPPAPLCRWHQAPTPHENVLHNATGTSADKPQGRFSLLFFPLARLSCPGSADPHGSRILDLPAGPSHLRTPWVRPESLWLLSWCTLQSPRVETLPPGKPYLSSPPPDPICLETPSWRRPQMSAQLQPCRSLWALSAGSRGVPGQPAPSCLTEASRARSQAASAFLAPPPSLCLCSCPSSIPTCPFPWSW